MSHGSRNLIEHYNRYTGILQKLVQVIMPAGWEHDNSVKVLGDNILYRIDFLLMFKKERTDNNCITIIREMLDNGVDKLAPEIITFSIRIRFSSRIFLWFIYLEIVAVDRPVARAISLIVTFM